MEKLRNKSILSFTLFLLCVTKYYLINYLQLIPVYGKSNRIISWLIIVPIMIIGSYLSVQVLYHSKKTIKKYLLDIILVLPMLFLIFYFFVLK